MRIWIVATYDHVFNVDRQDRALRYTILTEELLRRGHEVILWTSSFHHGRKAQREVGGLSIQPQQKYRVELLRGRSYSKNLSIARVQHNREIAKDFSRRALTEGESPDIILSSIPCLELAEAAVAYARQFKVPIVTDVVDIWPEVYLFPFPRWLRSMLRGLLFSEFKRAKSILVSSTDVVSISQEYLTWSCRLAGGRAIDTEKIYYLGYPSADEASLQHAEMRARELRKNWGIPEEASVVAFIGTFGRAYDIETVTRGARALVKERKIHFVLAGAGDKLASAQRECEGARNITLPGWVSYLDTLAILSTARIGISPYTENAPQSLPYKPFEYMSFGLPQVCSLRGEFQHILAAKHLGLWYHAGNTSQFCTCVRRLLLEMGDAEAAVKRRISAVYKNDFDSRKIAAALASRVENVARKGTVIARAN